MGGLSAKCPHLSSAPSRFLSPQHPWCYDLRLGGGAAENDFDSPISAAVRLMEPLFTDSEIQAIAQALGDTNTGLTGTQIGELLNRCRIRDDFASETKWRRLHKALWNAQIEKQNRTPVLAFVRKAMKPERHLRDSERYEVLRTTLNRALAFCGLAVQADGTLTVTDRARTIPEAEARARALKLSLASRGVHPDVLAFCRSELVVDNYFHSVLEASKSVAAKLRKLTNIDADGTELVDRVLSGPTPLLAINSLNTKSERSEQSGFATLLKGTFGMFRNPTAHEARVNWSIDKVDAEDLMSLLSLIHRRLDRARPNTFGAVLSD